MRNALVIGSTALLLSCGPNRMSTAPSKLAPVISEASREPSAAPEQSLPQVDFHSQVLPILEAKCQPCHFAGGKMYGQLPFDQPETIQKLGERLFTRIKDEEAQAVIREFLRQSQANDLGAACVSTAAP